MDDKELARFYENGRDDTSLWEERPSKANVRRGGTVVFSVRFDPGELTLLREKAEERGTTVSDLVRRAAIKEATEASSAGMVVVVMGRIPEHRHLPVYTAMLGCETSPFGNLTLESPTVREANVLFP